MNKSGLHGLEWKTRDPYPLVNDSPISRTHCIPGLLTYHALPPAGLLCSHADMGNHSASPGSPGSPGPYRRPRARVLYVALYFRSLSFFVQCRTVLAGGIQRSRPLGPLGSEVAHQSMRTAPERAISCMALRPGGTYLTCVLGQIQVLRDKERSMQIAGSPIKKRTSKSIRRLSHLANSSSLKR